MDCWMKSHLGTSVHLSSVRKFTKSSRLHNVKCEVCSSVGTVVFNIWGSCLPRFYKVSPCPSRLRPWLCKSPHSCGCAPSCCSAIKCPSTRANGPNGHAWSVLEAVRVIKSAHTLRLRISAGCQPQPRGREASKGFKSHGMSRTPFEYIWCICIILYIYLYIYIYVWEPPPKKKYIYIIIYVYIFLNAGVIQCHF